jgi:hypothetical protein
MKRLSLLVAALTMAGLWLGPVAPAAHATAAVRTLADPAACGAALDAGPTFTSSQAIADFVTTGPCRTTTLSASSPSAAIGTMACHVTAAHDNTGDIGFTLVDYFSDAFGSCSAINGTATVYCFVVTVVADAVSPVSAGFATGTTSCDAGADLQEVPLGLTPVGVTTALIIGRDFGTNIGEDTDLQIWTS